MKTKLLSFFALPVLLGACSSISQPTAQLAKTPPPVRIADKDSAWGKRPSYDDRGQYFVLSGRDLANRSRGLVGDTPLAGTATVDVLVNRDGTVRATKLVESSGMDEVDGLVVGMLQHGRYSLRLEAGDPAPHVLRRTISFNIPAVRTSEHASVDMTDYTAMGPQPDFSDLGVHTNYSYSTQTCEPK